MDNQIIQKAQQSAVQKQAGKPSINVLMNSILDGEGMRKRFQELLGERTPQFLSSIVSLVNADANLQRAMVDAPMTVVQSALKAATYDLPIDASLGFAYIVPFKDGKDGGKMKASFIVGYKGMIQLCLRTGAYSRIPDAVDVREGELVRYDRLTGDAEFNWIEDEDERNNKPVIGYAGYFRLKNGAEKTIYMTVKQIEQHELKNRKGNYPTKLFRDDFNAYASKTVIRRLCSKYGLMSIDYQDGGDDTVKLAQAVMENDDVSDVYDAEEYAVTDEVPAADPATGEVV